MKQQEITGSVLGCEEAMLRRPTLAVRLIVDMASIPPGRVRLAKDDTKPAGSSTCSITSSDATRSNCSPARVSAQFGFVDT